MDTSATVTDHKIIPSVKRKLYGGSSCSDDDDGIECDSKKLRYLTNPGKSTCFALLVITL